MEYKDIIIACSLIGDFRELDLTPAHSDTDDSADADKVNDKHRDTDIALRLACWLNSVEKKNVRHSLSLSLTLS